jgi:hypothetical protein
MKAIETVCMTSTQIPRRSVKGKEFERISIRSEKRKRIRKTVI